MRSEDLILLIKTEINSSYGSFSYTSDYNKYLTLLGLRNKIKNINKNQFFILNNTYYLNDKYCLYKIKDSKLYVNNIKIDNIIFIPKKEYYLKLKLKELYE